MRPNRIQMSKQNHANSFIISESADQYSQFKTNYESVIFIQTTLHGCSIYSIL